MQSRYGTPAQRQERLGALDDVPSAATNITLADKGFRNSYEKWTGYHIRDADGGSAAIPYCDILMTYKLRRRPAREVTPGRLARNTRSQPLE
jgi:hypothetical protein